MRYKAWYLVDGLVGLTKYLCGDQARDLIKATKQEASHGCGCQDSGDLGYGKCEEVANIVRKVVQAHDLAVQVEKVSGIHVIAEFGVLTTPAVVVDGDVKCAGRIPDPAEVLFWLTKHAASDWTKVDENYVG